MGVFVWLAAALTFQTPSMPSAQSRFQIMAPCPSAPPVMIDRYGSGIGLASETAKNKNLQGRVLWIDATANINSYNTPEKIQRLVDHIADSGFNTLVFDVKPISGQTVYPSKLAPKLLEWRGQSLPGDFDPIPQIVQAGHQHHLSVILSMNAFSEGHRLFKTGPGYGQLEHQSLLYVPKPFIRFGDHIVPLAPSINPTAPSKNENGTVSVYTTSVNLPKTDTDSFWVGIDSHLSVIATSDSGPTTQPIKEFLFGVGAAAKVLKSALIGTTITFDTEAKFLPTSQQPGAQIPLMMNLNDPEVQSHALAAVQEVAQNYPADGIIYDDRLRYSGLNADFSGITRTKFEKLVGHRLVWPEDVFKFTISPTLTQGFQPGPFYEQWIQFRAQQVQDFVLRVRQTVKQANPSMQFGAYVGSWYGDYPALGHNYASPDTKDGFWFATDGYNKAGTAPYLDYLMVGCYYNYATIYEAMGKGVGTGYTVEAGGALCNRLARDETWTYAGIDCGPFVDDPAELANLVQAACASTQGVMVFDLSHGMDRLWPIFKAIFGKPMQPPHAASGLLRELRSHRKIVDGFRQSERPVIILNGSAGIGQ